MSKKIVIVGAGPIGCYTAQLLKLYGFHPLLIEEHDQIGRPLHCTGLVGNKVFREKRPFKIPESSIINTINGAIFHYGDQHFEIVRKKVAYVIDRERFDKDLSSRLDILFQNKFLGLEGNRSGCVIETDKNEIEADLVIGADGANSVLRKIVNPVSSARVFRGLQFRLKSKARHKDMVEVYLKRSSFIWVVPEHEDVLRVGTISENPYAQLQDFLKEYKMRGDILDRFGGLVSIGVSEATVKENIALVGDAASQVKPITYGGIYFGLKAATILANCIINNRIYDYDRLWKNELALEIKIGLRARDMYNRLNDEQLIKLFKIMKKQKSFIENVADFENHSRLFLELIKRPSLYPQLGEFFGMFLRNII